MTPSEQQRDPAQQETIPLQPLPEQSPSVEMADLSQEQVIQVFNDTAQEMIVESTKLEQKLVDTGLTSLTDDEKKSLYDARRLAHRIPRDGKLVGEYTHVIFQHGARQHREAPPVDGIIRFLQQKADIVRTDTALDKDKRDELVAGILHNVKVLEAHSQPLMETRGMKANRKKETSLYYHRVAHQRSIISSDTLIDTPTADEGWKKAAEIVRETRLLKLPPKEKAIDPANARAELSDAAKKAKSLEAPPLAPPLTEAEQKIKDMKLEIILKATIKAELAQFLNDTDPEVQQAAVARADAIDKASVEVRGQALEDQLVDSINHITESKEIGPDLTDNANQRIKDAATKRKQLLEAKEAKDTEDTRIRNLKLATITSAQQVSEVAPYLADPDDTVREAATRKKDQIIQTEQDAKRKQEVDQALIRIRAATKAEEITEDLLTHPDDGVRSFASTRKLELYTRSSQDGSGSAAKVDAAATGENSAGVREMVQLINNISDVGGLKDVLNHPNQAVRVAAEARKTVLELESRKKTDEEEKKNQAIADEAKRKTEDDKARSAKLSLVTSATKSEDLQTLVNDPDPEVSVAARAKHLDLLTKAFNEHQEKMVKKLDLIMQINLATAEDEITEAMLKHADPDVVKHAQNRLNQIKGSPKPAPADPTKTTISTAPTPSAPVSPPAPAELAKKPADPVPTTIEAPKEFIVGISNRTADKQKRARELADEKITKEKLAAFGRKGEPLIERLKIWKPHPPAPERWFRIDKKIKRGFKRAGLSLFGEGFRQKYVQDAEQYIAEQGSTAVQFGEKGMEMAKAEIAQEKAHAAAGVEKTIELAKLQRDSSGELVLDGEKVKFAEGETRDFIMRNIIERSVQKLRRAGGYAEAEMQKDLRDLMESVDKGDIKVSKDVKKELQELFGRKANRGHETTDLFATNLLEISSQIVESAKAHTSAMTEMDKALFDRVKIVIGKTTWAAQTKDTFNAVDKVNAFMSRLRIPKILVNPITVGVVASAMSTVGCKAIPGALKVCGAIAPVFGPVASSVYGAAFAGIKRYREMGHDMSMHRREMAYGMKMENPKWDRRRKEFDKYSYNVAPASELLDGGGTDLNLGVPRQKADELLKADLTNVESQKLLIARMVEIKARMDMGTEKGVDLISYEGRHGTEVARLDMVRFLAQARRKLSDAGVKDFKLTSLEAMLDIQGKDKDKDSMQRLRENVVYEDRKFAVNKLWKSAQASVKAGVTGFVFGAIGQEAGALIARGLGHEVGQTLMEKGLDKVGGMRMLKTHVGLDIDRFMPSNNPLFTEILSHPGNDFVVSDRLSIHAMSDIGPLGRHVDLTVHNPDGTVQIIKGYMSDKGAVHIDGDLADPAIRAELIKGGLNVTDYRTNLAGGLIGQYGNEVEKVTISGQEVSIMTPKGASWVGQSNGSFDLMRDGSSERLMAGVRFTQADGQVKIGSWDVNNSIIKDQSLITETKHVTMLPARTIQERAGATTVINTIDQKVLGEHGAWEDLSRRVTKLRHYTNNTDGPGASDLNELRLDTFKQGDKIILSAERMVKGGSFSKSIDGGAPLNIDQMMREGRGAYTFFTSDPRHAGEALIVQPNGADFGLNPRELVLDVNADPKLMVTLMDGTKGTQIPLRDFSQMIVDEEYFKKEIAGLGRPGDIVNIATERNGHRELFALGGEKGGGRGVISFSEIVDTPKGPEVRTLASIIGCGDQSDHFTTTSEQVIAGAVSSKTIPGGVGTESIIQVDLPPELTHYVEITKPMDLDVFVPLPRITEYPLEGVKPFDGQAKARSKASPVETSPLTITPIPDEEDTPSPTGRIRDLKDTKDDVKKEKKIAVPKSSKIIKEGIPTGIRLTGNDMLTKGAMRYRVEGGKITSTPWEAGKPSVIDPKVTTHLVYNDQIYKVDAATLSLIPIDKSDATNAEAQLLIAGDYVRPVEKQVTEVGGLTEVGKGTPIDASKPLMVRKARVLPDLHGIGAKRVNELFLQGRQPGELIVYAGDLADRGPQSREVIEQMMAQVKRGDAIMNLGNHELLAMAGLEHTDGTGKQLNDKAFFTWFFNGGVRTLENYGITTKPFLDKLLSTAGVMVDGYGMTDEFGFNIALDRLLSGSDPLIGDFQAIISASRSNKDLQSFKDFLHTHGRVWSMVNDGLIVHAGIPVESNGMLKEVEVSGKKYKGIELLNILQEGIKSKDAAILHGLAIKYKSGDNPLWTRSDYNKVINNPSEPLASTANFKRMMDDLQGQIATVYPGTKVSHLVHGHDPRKGGTDLKTTVLSRVPGAKPKGAEVKAESSGSDSRRAFFIDGEAYNKGSSYYMELNLATTSDPSRDAIQVSMRDTNGALIGTHATYKITSLPRVAKSATPLTIGSVPPSEIAKEEIIEGIRLEGTPKITRYKLEAGVAISVAKPESDTTIMLAEVTHVRVDDALYTVDQKTGELTAVAEADAVTKLIDDTAPPAPEPVRSRTYRDGYEAVALPADIRSVLQKNAIFEYALPSDPTKKEIVRVDKVDGDKVSLTILKPDGSVGGTYTDQQIDAVIIQLQGNAGVILREKSLAPEPPKITVLKITPAELTTATPAEKTNLEQANRDAARKFIDTLRDVSKKNTIPGAKNVDTNAAGWYSVSMSPEYTAKSPTALNEFADARYGVPLGIIVRGAHARLVVRPPYQGTDGKWYADTWNPFNAGLESLEMSGDYSGDHKQWLQSALKDGLYVNQSYNTLLKDTKTKDTVDYVQLLNDQAFDGIRQELMNAKFPDIQKDGQNCIPYCVYVGMLVNALHDPSTGDPTMRKFMDQGIANFEADYGISIAKREAVLKLIGQSPSIVKAAGGSTYEVKSAENTYGATRFGLGSRIKQRDGGKVYSVDAINTSAGGKSVAVLKEVGTAHTVALEVSDLDAKLATPGEAWSQIGLEVPTTIKASEAVIPTGDFLGPDKKTYETSDFDPTTRLTSDMQFVARSQDGLVLDLVKIISIDEAKGTVDLQIINESGSTQSLAKQKIGHVKWQLKKRGARLVREKSPSTSS